MNEANRLEAPQTPTVLSDTEIAFLADPANWRHGPTFDVRFFFNQAFDFTRFEAALKSDPLCFVDPRFTTSDRVLLRHHRWSNCLGARYYDFQKFNRREPTIVFYPSQYYTVVGGNLSNARNRPLRDFLEPIIALARRVKTVCGADEVLLFSQDFYPRKSPETEVSPNVFLAEPIFAALN